MGVIVIVGERVKLGEIVFVDVRVGDTENVLEIENVGDIVGDRVNVGEMVNVGDFVFVGSTGVGVNVAVGSACPPHPRHCAER